MRYSIAYAEKTDPTLEYVLSKLPERVRTSIMEYMEENHLRVLNEIRIHTNAEIMLIADSKNIQTDIYVWRDDIEKIVVELCNGSIYAHIGTIKQGYISVGKGIRAGICGKAVLESGIIDGVTDITSINIRIPQRIYNASSHIFEILQENDFNTSILLYSSPGVGKTTILRDLICKLSDTFPPIRYSVIDSREEITKCLAESISGDIYLSYPKGVAIEMATKSMTPQIIICDEITTEEEAESILKSAHSGVRFIATAHAGSYNELMSKPILSRLIKSGVFDMAIGVFRGYGEKKYTFTENSLTEDL